MRLYVIHNIIFCHSIKKNIYRYAIIFLLTDDDYLATKVTAFETQLMNSVHEI